MISPDELRIGNWIEIKPPPNCDSGICMVEVIKRSSASLHCEPEDYFIADVPYEKIKPIELTPSILEQCGFEERGEFKIWTLREFDLEYYLDKTWYYTIDDRGDNEGTKQREIKYLHELQNLYFALTGEELNFQPHDLFSTTKKST